MLTCKIATQVLQKLLDIASNCKQTVVSANEMINILNYCSKLPHEDSDKKESSKPVNDVNSEIKPNDAQPMEPKKD